MNSHKHARLTLLGRKTLIARIARIGIKAAAAAAGISERTAHKWMARHRARGDARLVDRSSRPHRLRAALDARQRDTALTLRGDRLAIRAITMQQGVPVSTLRRFRARARR